MKGNFGEIIPYDVCCRKNPQLLKMASNKGHPISSRCCQVLFEKYHNQSSIKFQLILESEETEMELP